MAISGSDVYAAGYERNANNIEVAKYWKNGTAVSLTGGASTSRNARINGVPVILTDGTRNAAANSITVSGSDVYVAGYEVNKTYKYVAKYWKNGTEVVLTNGSKLAIATSIVIGN